MFTSFTSSLIAATALWTGSMAQLERECFYLTDMHGPYSEESQLLSNLPTLMAMYKPGMRLESITSIQDKKDGDKMSGLQINLHENKHGKDLQLPMVGADLDEWDSQKVKLWSQKPSRISILEDERYGGICDVVIYQGKQATSLSKDTKGCRAELKGIKETQIRLTDKAPLVGFHGMADEVGLTSLGLIFVDTDNKTCQKALDLGGIDMYSGADIADMDQVIEDSVTKEEHERAVALEAILIYDSMLKAKENAKDIADQIQALNVKHPIRTEPTKPASEAELKELLNRLYELDTDDQPASKEDLVMIFDTLSEHYNMYDLDSDIYELPIKVGQIKKVYLEIAKLDNDAGQAFNGRKDNQPADLIDLMNLLDELAMHYTSGYGSEPLKLGNKRIDSLVDIFDEMSQFYYYDDQFDDHPEYMDLGDIYDELAEVFGKKNDFDLADDEIDELYEKIIGGEELQAQFEGDMIANFDELMDLELEKNDEKVEKLVSEMKKMEEVEEQSRAYFKKEYSMQSKQIDSMMKSMSSEEDRLEKIQELIRQGEQEDSHQAQQKAELERRFQKLNQKVESESGQSHDDDVTVEQKVDVALESMIYTFLGIFTLAVVIGVAIGGLCLLCCMRCYQRGQKQRLNKAQKEFGVSAPKMTTIALESESKQDTQDLENGAKKVQISQAIEQNQQVTTENDLDDDITNQATDRKFSPSKAPVSRLNLTEIRKGDLPKTGL